MILQINRTMKKIVLLCLSLLSCVCSLYSQNRIIQGKIIDPDFETIVGVFIVINDSVCVGKSKLDGSFQVEIPSFVSKLSFCEPSYEQADLQLDDSCNVIELIMIEDAFYHMSYRKINRDRKKQYKLQNSDINATNNRSRSEQQAAHRAA